MEGADMTILADLASWWHTVPSDFAFLVALPFFVAAVAFIPDRLRALSKHQSKKTKAAWKR